MDYGGKRRATALSLTASGPASSIDADSSQSGASLRLPPQSTSVASQYPLTVVSLWALSESLTANFFPLVFVHLLL